MTLAVVAELSLIQCPFGTEPTPLNVLPDRTILAEGMLMGNITDAITIVNIPTFGECTTLSNPETEAATDAASGVLTPMPCIPVITDVWESEALTVIATEGSALDQTSIILCDYGGVIFVDEPGNATIMVP